MQFPREGLTLLFLGMNEPLGKPAEPLLRFHEALPMFISAFLERGKTIDADYRSEEGQAQCIGEQPFQVFAMGFPTCCDPLLLLLKAGGIYLIDTPASSPG